MVADWVLRETASADFGDPRLRKRFRVILSAIGNRPNLSIPSACNGRAEMEATYRFTDNDRVTFDNLIAPHSQCTLQRVAEHETALFVFDTTEIDLTRPEQQVKGRRRTGRLLAAAYWHMWCMRSRRMASHWARHGPRSSTAPMNQRPGVKPRLKSESGASRRRSSKRRACAGSPACERCAMRPSSYPIRSALALATARRTFMNCWPSRGKDDGPQVHWLFRACHDRALEIEDDNGQENCAAASSRCGHGDAGVV